MYCTATDPGGVSVRMQDTLKLQLHFSDLIEVVNPLVMNVLSRCYHLDESIVFFR